MNKGDLLAKIQSDADLTKAQADAALTAVLDGITAALQSGDSVSLVGFGTFSVNKRPARQGKNPRTLEVLTIPAKTIAKFKPGKKLTDSIN